MKGGILFFSYMSYKSVCKRKKKDHPLESNGTFFKSHKQAQVQKIKRLT